MRRWGIVPVLVLAAAWCLPSAVDDAVKDLQFRLVKVDGPAHDPARHTYWFGPFAECSSVLDINGDGKPDIAAGRNYYLAPNWVKHAEFRDGAATNGPDIDDNYEGTMDVNNDGRPDILSSGWMLKQGIYWYENPGKPGVKWTSHTMHAADGLEGMVIGNLAGRDGKDVLVNYFAKRPGRGLIWLEHLNQAPWFREHKLGPEGIGVSHGSGIGDINGDGRNDVVTTSGWFEAPPRPAEDPWIWHADYQFTAYGSDRPGGAGLPILVTDANGDGRNDIIMGSDHGYGLAWYEQKMEGGKRSFELHWIETEYPTFHTMALADLDGDGKPELITGKQLLAHNGGDVGVLEPSFVFYYTIDKGRFQRHILSYSHLDPLFTKADYSGPPPQNVIGVGMRLSVADLDGNGKQDVVVACRSGLYVFLNQGYTQRTRIRNPLPDRDSYPGNVNWEAKRGAAQSSAGSVELFNGRDFTGWQPATNWAIEDGVLTLKNRSDRQEHNDNYLWTQRPYGDFVLDLDFKVEPGVNSGVFLRTSDTKDPVQTGIEIQVGSVAPGRPLGRGSVGGIYDIVAPRVNALLPPGAWNHYTISCKGPNITVILNGQQVSEANLDQWTEVRKNPDGSPNKFTRAMKDFARSGYIGLQDHGTPAWFRNIRIRTQ
ncbi:MAG: family 16 glycoside hydrolase [Bryobacteraceae bacterium]